MKTKVEIEQETFNAMSAQAEAMGMTIDEYLNSVFCGGGQVSIGDAALNVDFEQLLDRLSGDSTSNGSLPQDFSRADIYNEHD